MATQTYTPVASEREDRYQVKVDKYVKYHQEGFLKVEKLLSEQVIDRLYKWANDLFYGRTLVDGLEPVQEGMSTEHLYDRIHRNRIHDLHKKQAEAEWGLLLPRVLDVTEALIGPDIMALQSMIFFNPPGRGGQGWHQDAYYIKTYPDILIGAWIALEEADEENGCLWVLPGSHCEPIYPPPKAETNGYVHTRGAFDNIMEVQGVSQLNDEMNTLTQVVQKYPDPIPVPMKPGDVLFFHHHLLHRSYPNRTTDRLRRSYVCHYTNARSWVGWNGGNENHILARGRTHLPFGVPLFGTHVDVTQYDSIDQTQLVGDSMMGMEDGMMTKVENK